MRKQDEDHGLYGIVFTLAIVLALVLVYYGLRRAGRAPLSWPSAKSRPPVGDSRDGIDQAPGFVSPLRLHGPAGRTPSRGARRKRTPPAVPLPPIAPDIE